MGLLKTIKICENIEDSRVVQNNSEEGSAVVVHNKNEY